jgi:hypothetical protein
VIIYRLTIFFILFSTQIAFSQKNAIPINISIFNEATAIPFTKLISVPIHPGIQIGTEINYVDHQHSRLFQTANLSYFYHNNLAQGIGLNSEFGYEKRLKSGFSFQALVGIGYLHTFNVADEFAFADGKYEKKSDRGNSRINPSISLDVGYYLNKLNRNSPRIFIRYQSWAEYPYSPDFIPVMTHINLHIGGKVCIKTNSND